MKPTPILIAILGLVLLGAACQKKTTITNISNTNTAVTTTFPSGIYFRFPNLIDPSAMLAHVGTALSHQTIMSPVDFDIQAQHAVYADNDTLFVVSPDGTKRTVKVSNLYQMARPTLSTDGQRVAVQATKTFHADRETGRPNELKIFVVDLNTGTATQISQESTTPNESPTWFNTMNKVAYSTFSPTEGIDIHIYDLDQQRIVMTLENAGGLHLTISPNDTQLLVPSTMSIYDLTTGKKVVDLNQVARQGIGQAGITLATNVGNTGSPFLDGAWSPDGSQLVFDVIVIEDSDPHGMIFTMNVDGTNVQSITIPTDVNPDFSNNFNFSQLNPVWL